MIKVNKIERGTFFFFFFLREIRRPSEWKKEGISSSSSFPPRDICHMSCCHHHPSIRSNPSPIPLRATLITWADVTPFILNREGRSLLWYVIPTWDHLESYPCSSLSSMSYHHTTQICQTAGQEVYSFSQFFSTWFLHSLPHHYLPHQHHLEYHHHLL